jgi:hypothetical protein
LLRRTLCAFFAAAQIELAGAKNIGRRTGNVVDPVLMYSVCFLKKNNMNKYMEEKKIYSHVTQARFALKDQGSSHFLLPARPSTHS